MLKKSSVTRNISTLAGVLCGLLWLAPSAQGGIIDMPGLTSITFYEATEAQQRAHVSFVGLPWYIN